MSPIFNSMESKDQVKEKSKEETELIQTFWSRLTYMCKKRGVSLLDLSRGVNISKRFWSIMKCRGALPGADKIMVAAKKLGVSVDWLLGMSQELPAAQLSKKPKMASPEIQMLYDWIDGQPEDSHVVELLCSLPFDPDLQRILERLAIKK